MPLSSRGPSAWWTAAGVSVGQSRDVNTRHSGRLVATLGAAVLTVAVLQTSVVPILGTIAEHFQVSSGAVGWLVTVNLLAAAAAAPLIGRLADLYNKKAVLLAILAVVLTGSVLAAATSSLPLLMLARALQGTSFGLYPVAISILRDELPPDRLMRAIGAVSATLVLGGAMALLFTGFLMPPGAGYHRVFWVLTAMTVAVIALSAATVPSRARHVTERVDWVGAVALALGLCCLMLAITKGAGWGWLSARTLGAAAAGTGVMALWWGWTRRCANPLVSIDMLKRRPVLLANSAGFMVGMGSYFSLLGLSTCAATPVDSGHGYGASAQGVSLQFLLPGALAATAAAMVTGRLIERFGARTVMVAGGAVGATGFAMLAGWHADRWQLLGAGLLTSVYVSLAYGAITALIVEYVGPGETGVANSLNGIFSKVGGATAAAMVAPLLSSVGAQSGSESGYLTFFATGAITAAVAVALVWLSQDSARRSRTDRDLVGAP